MPEDVIEDLVRWFRQTEATTDYGKVGFYVCKHAGRVTLRTMIYEKTEKGSAEQPGRAMDSRP